MKDLRLMNGQARYSNIYDPVLRRQLVELVLRHVDGEYYVFTGRNKFECDRQAQEYFEEYSARYGA